MELDIRWWHLIRLRGEGMDIPFSIKKTKKKNKNKNKNMNS